MKRLPNPIKRISMGGAAIVAVALAGLGCGDRKAAFAPTEAEQPIGPDYPAAHYEVRFAGETVGDVRVWSPGAYRVQTNGKTPAIHIGLRLRNDGAVPLQLSLDQTSIEVITKRQQFIPVERAMRYAGNLRVEPGTLERIDLYYPLPAGLDVDDVNAFDLNWAIDTASGRRYTHSTPFVRREPEPAQYVYQPLYAYRYPFYDPWFY